MFAKIFSAGSVLLVMSTAAHSAEQGTSPVPGPVLALSGCGEGRGDVMSKSVAIAINAYPIVQDAMLALEAVSSAIGDPQDQYAAHLVFGGAGKQSGTKADQIVGYWADSFGGAFATSGRGAGSMDGFEITYQYPNDAYVNRWRFSGDDLAWQIAARDGTGLEKPFASYELRKVACRSQLSD